MRSIAKLIVYEEGGWEVGRDGLKICLNRKWILFTLRTFIFQCTESVNLVLDQNRFLFPVGSFQRINMLENRTLHSAHLFGNNNFFKQSNSRWPNKRIVFDSNILPSTRTKNIIFCRFIPSNTENFPQKPPCIHWMLHTTTTTTIPITYSYIIYLYHHLYKTHHHHRSHWR